MTVSKTGSSDREGLERSGSLLPVTPRASHPIGKAHNGPPRRTKRRSDLIHISMVLGIVFCVADTFYIIHRIEHYHLDGSARTTSSTEGMMASIRQRLGSAEHYLQDQLHERLGQAMEQYNAPLIGGTIPTQTNAEAGNKEPIFELIRDAGIDPYSLGNDTLNQLPTWEQVTSLYGTEPVFYGLDTCQRFREHSDPAEHFIGVAGTFNTGTNLLADLLQKNCYMPERVRKYGAVNRGMRWQVTYGGYGSFQLVVGTSWIGLTFFLVSLFVTAKASIRPLTTKPIVSRI